MLKENASSGAPQSKQAWASCSAAGSDLTNQGAAKGIRSCLVQGLLGQKIWSCSGIGCTGEGKVY